MILEQVTKLFSSIQRLDPTERCWMSILRRCRSFGTTSIATPIIRGIDKAEVAYVLPKDYGFGLRRADDTIWGLWNADEDEFSEKIWSDVNKLIAQYGSQLDVVYDDPEFFDSVKNRYDKLFFWNETIP